MRIISEFHDYYDCVQAYGQDMNTIYQRKEKKTAKYLDRIFPMFYIFCHYRNPFYIKDWTIGFCGKVYPVLEVWTLDTTKSDYCYNLEEFDASLERNYKKKQIEEHYLKETGWKRRKSSNRDGVKKFFAEFEDKKESFEYLFKENRSPIFIANERNREKFISYNVQLKDYEFIRIFDPHTAYQEIAMYMYNFAEPMKEIPILDDVTMAEIKGFDKHSFRKDPTKKKGG